MLLFVGLGNPGARHAGNRHNIGFMVVDTIAKRHGIGPWRRRFQGVAAEGSIGAETRAAASPRDFHERIRPRGGGSRAFLQARASRDCRVPRRTRSAARQGAGQNRRRRCRAQRPALDLRPYRQRLPARAHRHRPSRRQGIGASLRAEDFAKIDRRWVEALCDSSPTTPNCCARAGRELPEQGASRHGGQRICRRQGRASRRTPNAHRNN